MPRSSPARRALVVAAGAIALLAVLAPPAAAAPPTSLNANDMALISGVQLTAVWEQEAGQLAAQKAQNQRVRAVGQEIARQHDQLDRLVTEAADTLGVTLAEPPAAKPAWLQELGNASGAAFDRAFVTGLRGALGKLLPVVMAVRSATRDPVVRKLADQTNLFVMNHMRLLEGTGLVQFDKLPPGALPPAQDLSSLGMAQADAGVVPPISTTVLWMVFIGMAAIACLASVRVWRGYR